MSTSARNEISDSLVADWVTGLRAASHPVISPSDDWVAFLVTGINADTLKPIQEVMLLNLAASASQIIASDLESVSTLARVPDSETLLVAGKHAATDQVGLWKVSLAASSSELLVLTEDAINELAVSPDGRRIAWSRRITPPPVDLGDADLAPVRVIRDAGYKEDGVGLPNAAHMQVELFDTLTGSITRLTDGPFDQTGLAFSPDGQHLGGLEQTRIGLTSRLWIHDLEANVTRFLTGLDRVARAWAWEPTGAGVVHFSSTHPEINGDLFQIDLVTGVERQITDRWDPCLDFYQKHLGWTGQHQILVGGYDSGRSAVWAVDHASGNVTLTWHGDCMDHDLVVAPNRHLVVRCRDSATASGELVAVDLATAEERILTQLNVDVIQAHPLATIEERVADNAGQPVPYLLKRPANFDPQATYPVIFELHGGPHFLRGFAVEVANQLLTERGYIVVCPNPRGSVSWSRAYAEGVWGDWGGGDWQDILAVVDEVATLPFVDADRMGVYGYSYGGYLTSWAIGQTDRFQAAIIGAPLTNLVTRIGTADIGYLAAEQEYMAEVLASRDRLLQQSPVWHMHQATTPSLILHPEEDQRCPIEQSEQLFEGLLRAGVTTEFVRYPGQSHGMPWSGPAAFRIDYYVRLLAWFERFIPPTREG